MKNTPSTHQTDQEAEAEAAEARRRGTEMIENHLSVHLSQNPDSSFVTWIATLHPENAEVSIDHRFFVSNNPWWTVYEGAKNDIPIATAVPVNDDLAAASEENIPGSTYNPTKNIDNSSNEKSESKSPCNPIDSFVGSILSLTAILAVLGLETGAFLVYYLAAGFWKAAKGMGHYNIVTWIFYHIFMLVHWSLSIVDSSLLLGSVVTVELVAGVCYILSLLFAGFDKAARWHQYIRRTCHTLRWAFRSQSSSPPRHFCGHCSKKEGPSNDEDDDLKDVEGQIQPQFSGAKGPVDATAFVDIDEKGAGVEEKSGSADDYKGTYAN